jgi:UDP:flavonoid glycosyltransferase YjiC (YdhE family)
MMRSAARWAQARVPTRTLRRKLGLPPFRGNAFAQATSPRLNLLSWSKDFALGPPGRSARYVGPLVSEPPGRTRPPRWLSGLERDRPVVLVGASTLPIGALDALVQNYVEQAVTCLNAMRVRGIVTVPSTSFRLKQTPGRHLTVTRFVPHALLMPHLSTLVTHGGWGTIGRALLAGVPMVIVPFALDQPLNAQACVDRGVSVSVDADGLTAAALRERLEAVLPPSSPVRKKARAVAGKLNALGGADRAAELILAL